MYFRDLRYALVQDLRVRVRNGQITERRLARLVGASQPHIHNVLKGTRFLSVEMSDRILEHLGVTVLDLISPGERPRAAAGSLIRVLEGLIGPGQPWPERLGSPIRVPLSSAELARMGHPVAAKLAADPHMASVFGPGEWVILDQSPEVRLQLDPEAFYLIRQGKEACIRRVRFVGTNVYLVPEDLGFSPAQWQRIPTAEHELLHVVRARIRFLPPDPRTWFDEGA
jgi:hypothetical protein